VSRDTPVQALTAGAQLGIKFLSTMQQPFDREQLRRLLTQACRGELRRSSPEKARAIRKTRAAVLALALVVALVTNAMPALWENYLTYTLGTNGMTPTFLECNNCSTAFVCDAPVVPACPGPWHGLSPPMELLTVRARPGRLSALSVPQLSPMKIHFGWGVCMGAQGA
jgi:hypothetical protein